MGFWDMQDEMPVPTSEILDMRNYHVIDKNGKVWFFQANSNTDRQWINLGHP
jgi:hypothetical protein